MNHLKFCLLFTFALMLGLTLQNKVNAQNAHNPNPDLGIILNTVAPEMDKDYEATLKQLAAMGYTWIEGGYYGESAATYRQLLEKLGLKSLAYGSNLDELANNLAPVIETAEQLKVPYIVCYFPWSYDWETRWDHINAADAKKAAVALNAIGQKCREAGFQFVWHNHDLEFKTLENGETAFDIILQNTNSELVKVELDVYWTTKGGGDPVKVMKKYKGRIPLLHMKDMTGDEEKTFACVGDGILDFKKIVKTAKEIGVKQCIVEHDHPADGIVCAQTGYTTLSQIISKL